MSLISLDQAQTLYNDLRARAETSFYSALPTDTAQGAIATFPDGADNVPVKSLVADIDPVQNLNGYDNPWPAGGGKNKLNNRGVSGTNNGVAYTANPDGSVKLYGLAGTGNSYFTINTDFTLPDGTYVLSGVTGGGQNTYCMYLTYKVNGGASQYLFATNGDSSTITVDSTYTFTMASIRVMDGVSVNTTIYPMMRLASDTDPTFAPYSNICPISGWTGANIYRAGGNLANVEFEQGAISAQDGAGTPYSAYKTASTARIRSKNVIYASSGAEVFVSFDNANYDVVVQAYDASGLSVYPIPADYNEWKTEPFKFTSTGSFAIAIRNKAQTTIDDSDLPNVGLSALAPTIINIDWTDEAGTVYGGTLTYIGNGKYSLQQIMARVDLGTLTWTESSNNRVSSTGIASVVKRPPDANTAANILAEKYKTYSTNGMVTDGIIGVSINPTSGNVIARTGSSDNPTGYMIYELATLPDPIILNAEDVKTLLGDNNIFVDTGDVSVDYRADIALYIQKVVNA